MRSAPLERVEQRVELPTAADERRPHARRDVDADAAARLERLPGLDRLGLSLGLNRLGGPVVDGSRVARHVVSPTRMPLTGAFDWSRAAVLTTSPATMPSPSSGRAPSETSAWPGVDADAELELGLLVEDPVADGECRSYCALGIVLVGDRSAEHGHHGVADELLDRAAEALELVAQPRVVGPEQRAHLLGIHPLRARGEADEVGEEDGDDLALLEPRLRPRRRAARRRRCRSARRRDSPGRSGDR